MTHPFLSFVPSIHTSMGHLSIGHLQQAAKLQTQDKSPYLNRQSPKKDLAKKPNSWGLSQGKNERSGLSVPKVLFTQDPKFSSHPQAIPE